MEKLNIDIEKLEVLNEEELREIAELCNIQLEKLENELMVYYDQNLTEQDIIEKGFNFDEYYRIKKLEKKAYSCIRKLQKSKFDGSFIGQMPIWGVILFFVVFLLNIYPVSPYLPMTFYELLMPSMKSDFMLGIDGLILYYIVYTCLSILYLIVTNTIFFIKRRKSIDAKKRFFVFLIFSLCDLLAMIPSIIIFTTTISAYK